MRKGSILFLALFSLCAAIHCSADTQNAPSQVLAAVDALKNQQLEVANNQSKIDEKIADLAETIRVARLYMSRAGGAAQTPTSTSKKMNAIKSLLLALLIVAAQSIATTNAQSPAPIIIQAADAPAIQTAPSKAVEGAPDAQSITAAIQILEQLKASNADVLAKQKAALEKLSELKEAADQLQIFAHRSGG